MHAVKTDVIAMVGTESQQRLKIHYGDITHRVGRRGTILSVVVLLNYFRPIISKPILSIICFVMVMIIILIIK